MTPSSGAALCMFVCMRSPFGGLQDKLVENTENYPDILKKSAWLCKYTLPSTKCYVLVLGR